MSVTNMRVRTTCSSPAPSSVRALAMISIQRRDWPSPSPGEWMPPSSACRSHRCSHRREGRGSSRLGIPRQHSR
jgi:hypothetical protein